MDAVLSGGKDRRFGQYRHGRGGESISFVSDHGATDHPKEVRLLVCVECGCVSGLRAFGWRGYRIDVEEDDDPAVAFYCPACATRQFDLS